MNDVLEASQLTSVITHAVARPEVARHIRKPLLDLAAKLAKKVDGDVASELALARANLEALGG